MASDAVAAVTDTTFKQEVLDSPIPTLVDFWAAWCAPCRAIAPIVEELAKQYAGKVKVVKLNVDENPQTATQFRIMGIPTLLLFKGGSVVDQVVGLVPRPKLEAVLSKVAGKLPEIAEPESVGGSLIRGLSAFLAPFGAARKVTGGLPVIKGDPLFPRIAT